MVNLTVIGYIDIGKLSNIHNDLLHKDRTENWRYSNAKILLPVKLWTVVKGHAI